ncbi:MAG: ABC transporter permease [Candidatus Tyrphobacter sp.]
MTAGAGAQRRSQWLRVLAVAVIFVVFIGAVDWAAGGAFLRLGNVRTVLQQITYNFILAIGETFVIITAGIDLSIGSLVSLCGVVMAIVANDLHLGGFALIVITLLCGIAVGSAAGYVNALPVVKLNLPPFITTLAMMQIALGASYILSAGRPVPLLTPAFANVGTGYVLGVPVPVLWMLAVGILSWILLGKTRFGRYVIAIGGNEEASRLAGIDVAKMKTLAYVISGGCAAIVGFLYLALFSSGSPQTGTGNEMLGAIAAVVVGGTSLMGGRGTIVGTFFGALLIGSLNNAMNLLDINSYLQMVVLGAVILAAVTLDELRKRYLR